MAFSVILFSPDHLRLLTAQAEQSDDHRAMLQMNNGHWERIRNSFTVCKDELILACGGVIHHWNGRGELWIIMSFWLNRSDMLFLHRTVKKFLDDCHTSGYARLEASVLQEFAAGHKWLKMLGFEAEGVMRRYDPAGKDHVSYAKIS